LQPSVLRCGPNPRHQDAQPLLRTRWRSWPAHGPLTFVKEDDAGTSPKFEVKDADGTKWKAKLGPEAQPETVATRLMWAVGFITNENYFMSDTKVADLPHLKRGQEFVVGDEVKASGYRGKPKARKWVTGVGAVILQGTREFNGLRVMMALLSNWDLKDDNNVILEDRKNPGHVLYEVSDLGASFGRSGKSYSDRMTKHNFAAYRRSKFISKRTRNHVDFAFPTHPPFIYAFNLPFFLGKMRNHWIGKHIPREDAKWMGSELPNSPTNRFRTPSARQVIRRKKLANTQPRSGLALLNWKNSSRSAALVPRGLLHH